MDGTEVKRRPAGAPGGDVGGTFWELPGSFRTPDSIGEAILGFRTRVSPPRRPSQLSFVSQFGERNGTGNGVVLQRVAVVPYWRLKDTSVTLTPPLQSTYRPTI
jgi:hypothetical protein